VQEEIDQQLEKMKRSKALEEKKILEERFSKESL